MTIPQGFTFSGVRCGLKNKRNDLGIILSDRPAHAAGLLGHDHSSAGGAGEDAGHASRSNYMTSRLLYSGKRFR